MRCRRLLLFLLSARSKRLIGRKKEKAGWEGKCPLGR